MNNAESTNNSTPEIKLKEFGDCTFVFSRTEQSSASRNQADRDNPANGRIPTKTDPVPASQEPCWICEKNLATTREHIFKKSDLKTIFGNTQFNSGGVRIVGRSESDKAQLVQGADSSLVKYPLNLCETCNSELSQPYDKGWERLSKILLTEPAPTFPFLRDGLLNVHLYFAKTLGCAMHDESRVDANFSLLASNSLARLREGLQGRNRVDGLTISFHTFDKHVATEIEFAKRKQEGGNSDGEWALSSSIYGIYCEAKSLPPYPLDGVTTALVHYYVVGNYIVKMMLNLDPTRYSFFKSEHKDLLDGMNIYAMDFP